MLNALVSLTLAVTFSGVAAIAVIVGSPILAVAFAAMSVAMLALAFWSLYDWRTANTSEHQKATID